MTSLLKLARPEVRELKAYVPANYADGAVRLNANESPERSDGDTSSAGMHRYPEARPKALTQTLAKHFGVPDANVFVTRGSSEAIDLMIRCFCRPNLDGIVISPPTFGMYSVYANLQSAAVRSVPLVAKKGFTLPVDAIVDSWRGTDRLVFVTSPNNPTGNAQSVSEIARLAAAIHGRGIVVVDGAYAEFADLDAMMSLLEQPNIVMLRTMSKAYGLAGARCGAALGPAEVIDLLAKTMPPYAVPTPSSDAALAVLAEEALATMPARLEWIVTERNRLATALGRLNLVERVYPSDANFLLVKFRDPQSVLDIAAREGLLLRDFSAAPLTPNCLRISVGKEADNTRLIEILQSLDARSRGAA
ncbi:MAG: histidinol-phosphate transaminase [Pseudomonadota bacterium]